MTFIEPVLTAILMIYVVDRLRHESRGSLALLTSYFVPQTVERYPADPVEAKG